MKKFTIILALICFASTSFSQKLERTFSEITPGEIAMTFYENDPDAGAVILFDIGESKFVDSKNGYDIHFTRHKRIKIFDKSAFDQAEIKIPFYVDGYGKTEFIQSIDAITFNNIDGRTFMKKLNHSTVYEEKISQQWYVKKFVFPDVQEGSILDLKYTLVTPFHINLPDWEFQDKIPTIYSEYEIRMIPFYEYVYIVQGISRFDFKESYIAKTKRTWGSVGKSYGQTVGTGVEFQDYVHTYVLKNIPAFKDETFITSINDYIIKMDFQLSQIHRPNGTTTEIISTWPELNKALLKNEHFGKYMKSSSKYAKKVLSDIDLSELTTMEQSKKCINYVKKNYIWNKRNSKYASQSAKEFQINKTGNSAEINLFLIALLNQADIEAKPVILSTRDHGKTSSDYPFDHFTNYVIALIETDSPYLADASNSQLPYTRLPIKCLNVKGLIVSEDDEQWVKLENNIPSLTKTVIHSTLDIESVKINANINIQSTEYEAYSNRVSYEDDVSDLTEYYEKKIGEINSLKTFAYEHKSKPYSIVIDGVAEPEQILDNIVFKPFFDLVISENMLKQKTRDYPVDLIYPRKNIYESTTKIPEGFKVEELPDAYQTNNKLVEIDLSYQVMDGYLKVVGLYYFKKAVYQPEEYTRIKVYLDRIIKKFNTPVVVQMDQD